MVNLTNPDAAYKAPHSTSYPHRIPTPTRGDMMELLATFVAQWDAAQDPVDLMKRITPAIKQARRFVDQADQRRLADGDL